VGGGRALCDGRVGGRGRVEGGVGGSNSVPVEGGVGVAVACLRGR